MLAVISKPDTGEKLRILSADSQYDLACACGTRKGEHRRRSGQGNWIYPVTLPNGGTSVLFKSLVSNVCNNDCRYCPLRESMDVRRCSLGVDETARVFLDYLNRGEVFGLFLSSGVIGSPDATMERLTGIARTLRKKHRYRGYIHLKIIPGASNAAVEEAVSLSSAVSLNIETPGEANLAKLSSRKRYIEDIIEPMKLISQLTGRGGRYAGVKQTTQFIVGAAGEKDREIVKYTAGLYQRLKLQRVYFSAYQKGLGDEDLPGEQDSGQSPDEIFTREHRLYQVDFLFRKYGFDESDIIFDDSGSLRLDIDPKELWASRHPEAFPVRINQAGYYQLLRVPGLGPLTVKRILERRKVSPICSIDELGKVGVRLNKAKPFLTF